MDDTTNNFDDSNNTNRITEVLLTSSHIKDDNVKFEGSFSALIVITYSKEFALECLRVIKSSEHNLLQKLISLIRLCNNYMNMEAFFYFDLILTLILSIYSLAMTNNPKHNSHYQYDQPIESTGFSYNPLYPYMPPGIQFYFYGNLFANCFFLWYFSYCRFLNGKDVITLRRSIQLLSHAFQLGSIGLLIECNKRNNHISDLEYYGYGQQGTVYGEVTFICKSDILLTYSFRVIWHTVFLFKTLLDEYLSGFIISKGTLIDLLMLSLTPIFIPFSYITNYNAELMMNYMIKSLSVNYEVNNISRITDFYNELTVANNSKFVNILIFSSTVWITTIFFGTLFGPGYILMAEYYICSRNTYGLLVISFFTMSLIFLTFSCLGFLPLVTGLMLLFINILLLVLVIYQNRSKVSILQIPGLMLEPLLLICYLFFYCPFHSIVSYFYSGGCKLYSNTKSNDKNESENNNKNDNSNKNSDINKNDNTSEDQSKLLNIPFNDNDGCSYISLFKVPLLLLISPVIEYYWDNFQEDVKIICPSLKYLSPLSIKFYENFTASRHNPELIVIIWILFLIVLSNTISRNTMTVYYRKKLVYDDYSGKHYFESDEDFTEIIKFSSILAYIILGNLIIIIIITSHSIHILIYQF